MKVRHLLIGLASSTALYSGFSSALGLGEIELNSALSQPLNAQIKLLNVGDLDNNDLRVRLAPAEVYSRAGVERLAFFNDLRFTPVFDGANSVIRVVSNTPVAEPYLNFIVELERPNGQLYREYTLLLDPPGFSAYQSVSAVQSVSQAQTSAPAPRMAPPQAPAPAPVSAPAVMPKAELGKGYSVASGDSLWKIARRHADSDHAIPSLMADIFALNPQAFVGGDANRLRAGVQLRLPDRVQSPSSTPALSTAEAPAAPESAAPEAAPAAPVATAPAPVAPAEQTAQVETELLKQVEQTQQLQSNLDALAQQVQLLQEQMIARDQQIDLLQAELAERAPAAEQQAPVASVAPVAPVAPAQAAPQQTVESATASNWLTGAAGLLALVMAGVLALFWRKNRNQKPLGTMPEVAPVVAHKPAAIAPVFIAAGQSASDTVVPLKAAATPKDAMQTANVYIAYGHYQEAAAALSEAWAAEPQRGDLGFRYLEVLAKLGDAKGYLEVEPQVRATGFNAVRLDELKASHPLLFVEAPVNLLSDVQLDEPVQNQVVEDRPVKPLNLDDFSLNADWDVVNPFAAVAPDKAEPVQESATIFDLSDSRDARSPFAQSMLVEESGHAAWKDDLSTELLELDLQLDDDYASQVQDNLGKLNLAQAFIDQGNIEGACKVLNEVLVDGDEHSQQEARNLLAKIA